jgi:hypothetical protein
LFDKISKQINKIKKIGIRKCFKKHILTSKQIGLDELKPNQLDLKFLFWGGSSSARIGWSLLAQPDDWHKSGPAGHWNKPVTRLVTVHACVNYSRMLCTVTG